MADKEFRDLMDEEARAAEEAPDEDDGQPPPPHVTVSRPNQARSKVLQVRLNPEEFEAVERIAERRGLPVSTVAREQLMKLLETDEATVRHGLTTIIEAANGLSAMAHQWEILLGNRQVEAADVAWGSQTEQTRR